MSTDNNPRALSIWWVLIAVLGVILCGLAVVLFLFFPPA